MSNIFFSKNNAFSEVVAKKMVRVGQATDDHTAQALFVPDNYGKITHTRNI
jgi:hypothetical protein